MRGLAVRQDVNLRTPVLTRVTVVLALLQVFQLMSVRTPNVIGANVFRRTGQVGRGPRPAGTLFCRGRDFAQ